MLIPNEMRWVKICTEWTTGFYANLYISKSPLILLITLKDSLVCLCNIHSTVGRSIADIYDLWQHMYRGSKRHSNILPRSYIEDIDQLTTLYIIYTMMSPQQTSLLPENTSLNDATFAQSLFTLLQDHLTMLKFLYGCAITIVCILLCVQFISTHIKDCEH